MPLNDRKVSVVMPCWNSEKFLAETLESVLSQTMEDWELLAVDDGSTDGTYAMLERYAAEHENIRVLQGEHRGSAAARNLAIRNASGRYIAFLDSDDLWKPEYLETQLSFMQSKRAACVACNYAFIDEGSREILRPVCGKATITLKDMLITNRIGMLTGMYDSHKLGKHYFDESFVSLRDDYAYWIEIVKAAGTAYRNDMVLAKYRVSPNSTTGKKAGLIGTQYRFYRRYLKLGPVTSVRNLLVWGARGLNNYAFRKLRK